MHVTETFRILNKKQCNWMLLLPISLRRYISKCIRQIVMSTDLKFHGINVANLEGLTNLLFQDNNLKRNNIKLARIIDENGYASLDLIKSDGIELHCNIDNDIIVTQPRIDDVPDERIFILECIVHFADISNPAKPILIAKKWAERVMTEFFNQGDRERDLGLPVTPMMDRKVSLIEKVQSGFLNFVVLPYCKK